MKKYFFFFLLFPFQAHALSVHDVVVKAPNDIKEVDLSL